MPPMEIAFYAPLKAPDHPVPSGDRRMARLLIQALTLAGHRVSVASNLRSWDDGRVPGRPERLAAVGETQARRLIRRYRAQERPPQLWFTYHLYHKAPDWLGPAVTRALGIPYVVAEPSFAPKRALGPWALGHGAVAAALAQADAALCLTRLDAACVRPCLSAPDKLVLLPPFLDPAPALAAAAERERHRQTLAAAHGLDPARPWLLAVAMMRHGDKRQSYRLLAQALARVGHLPWQLVLAGDGPARALIEQDLAALPAGRVRLLGAVPGELLPRWYAACDLLVWPALNEAYGMALLEAQAAGLPVVAGRCGGVAEVVGDGSDGAPAGGLLVPPGDPAALAAAVADLLARPERRRVLAQGALARVAQRHTLTQAATTLDRVLAAVVRSREIDPPTAAG